MNEAENWVGFFAGIFSVFALMPQAMKIHRTKSAKDVSAPTFMALAAGASLWITYGLIIHSGPIVSTNTIMLSLSICILAMKARYR